MVKQICSFLLVLFSVGIVNAQSTDEKLAAQFYENAEYDKAVELYKKIYKRNKTVYVYENYLNCLIALEDEKEATSLVKKQSKAYNNSVKYLVDYGYILQVFNKEEQAQNYYASLIEENTNDVNKAITLAQTFLRRQQTKQVVQTYELGMKKLGTMALYRQALGAYRITNNYNEMIGLALRVLDENSGTLNPVVNQLSTVFNDEAATEKLREQTMLYIQRNPGKVVFEELLLEIYLQQKKYAAAFRQASAMDKRNKEEGNRVLQLAELCTQNNAYDVAIKAYRYVLDLGENNLNYFAAQEGLINTLFFKTKASYTTNKEELGSLIALIEELIEKEGINYNTVGSLIKLAELNIFYDQNVARGIELLEKAIVVPRQSSNQLAQAKLLLGDAHLINNNIWEAKLLYGQVDKTFKEDAFGQEAKFRNARLSYFTGDFDWAKSQLDILKTATTQLISNNAIQLSLLIQDNTGLDSTEDAMKEYAEAEFLLFQNKIEACIAKLNMLPFKYPNHSLADEIVFLKAKVEEKRENFDLALQFYSEVYTKHSGDILADNALYNAANIQLFVNNKTEEALKLYEQILLDYSSGLFSAEARKKYYALKEGATKEDLFFEGRS
jgi:tetratricopeptide (TPR) repeat protein